MTALLTILRTYLRGALATVFICCVTHAARVLARLETSEYGERAGNLLLFWIPMIYGCPESSKLNCARWSVSRTRRQWCPIALDSWRDRLTSAVVSRSTVCLQPPKGRCAG